MFLLHPLTALVSCAGRSSSSPRRPSASSVLAVPVAVRARDQQRVQRASGRNWSTLPWWKSLEMAGFFPTCQVRVLRFYQSCSSPPRLAVLLLLLLLLLLRLRLLLKFLLDHVCINFHLHFRPQHGTCPAQCAPLDLNLGPAQLSVHRWTSTWDLPSSVCTAGPQTGACPAQCAPLDLNGQIECQKICQIECQIECQKICQIKCHKICQIECQKVYQIECQKICQIECQKVAR